MKAEPNGRVLLAAACNFGWGSVGKLRLILDELEDVRVVMYGEPEWVRLTQRLLFPAHSLGSVGDDVVPQAALVINDPAAADAIAAMGVAVVYVDSLPYMWARPDEIPGTVATYCAQRSPARTLPTGSPLADRAGLIWIDPIVPRRQGRSGGGGVVINVGGLHSHLSGNADDAYLALVIVPLVRSLAAAGHRIMAVCGNIPRVRSDELTLALGNHVPVGPQTAYQFENLLRHADVLVTSPGSTTLLQATAMRLPMVLLPPQNLSQILNTEIFATADTPVVGWPTSILDRAEVERLRPFGEDSVLKYIYSAICEAAQSHTRRTEVAAGLAATVEAVQTKGSTLDSVFDPGMSGAVDVARIVRRHLNNPAGL